MPVSSQPFGFKSFFPKQSHELYSNLTQKDKAKARYQKEILFGTSISTDQEINDRRDMP